MTRRLTNESTLGRIAGIQPYGREREAAAAATGSRPRTGRYQQGDQTLADSSQTLET